MIPLNVWIVREIHKGKSGFELAEKQKKGDKVSNDGEQHRARAKQ